MKRTELYSTLAQLTDEQLVQLFKVAQVLGTVPTDIKVDAQSPKASKPDNALVQTVAPKTDKFSYKSLRCTKGIPSKVWSAIHHCVVENGGTYDRRTKTWNFKTIKACKTTYESQVAYAKSHGTELCIEAF